MCSSKRKTLKESQMCISNVLPEWGIKQKPITWKAKTRCVFLKIKMNSNLPKCIWENNPLFSKYLVKDMIDKLCQTHSWTAHFRQCTFLHAFVSVGLLSQHGRFSSPYWCSLLWWPRRTVHCCHTGMESLEM